MSRVVLVTGGSGFVGGRMIERLRRDGWTVRALARSPAARARVEALGARPVDGDLAAPAGLSAALEECEAVLHAAALFKLWGTAAQFERVNVQGTAALLDIARARGSVRRFVQIGAAAVVMGDPEPIVGATEALPLQERAWAPYAASKARSEALVLRADAPGRFETVVIRPPMIWGAGMPTLDHMVDAVRAGRFRWPGDGSHAMSVAHVDNLCHAAALALERGPGGQAYFVSDGVDRPMRDVIGTLLRTRGVEPPTSSVAPGVAWTMAAALETAWRAFGRAGEPPLTRQMLRLVGQPFTVDIAKARTVLGYAPRVDWARGVAAMSEPAARQVALA